MNTRVAIIGCGQFARAHISALQQTKGLEIVAVCDQDLWRAKEFASLAKAARPYGDLAALLQQEHTDVVHILTPPNTHASLAIRAMEAGCHVLVEKPMALTQSDADCMIESAIKNGVKLGTNHNYLFNPCILKARKIFEDGVIGEVVYVNAYYGLNESGSSYTSIAGRSHWAWRLPGGAFTNFIPHLIYLELAFLPSEVAVAGVTIGHGTKPGEPPTELTALLQGSGASGVMTVSMRARPYAKFIDIYGTKGIIHADLATEVCTLHRIQRMPGMLTKVLFNLEESAQLAVGTIANTTKVALGHLKQNPGLNNHLREFYAHLQQGKDLPVKGEDGKRMIQIMEQVWAQSATLSLRTEAIPLESPRSGPETNAERIMAHTWAGGKVLVTGATGFLGYHLVAALSRSGVQVKSLIRDRSRVSSELEQQSEIVTGDVRDPISVKAAMRDVALVYHCAAVTNNSVSWQTHQDTNVAGTEVVLRAALSCGVKRVVHVSSVIVYGFARPPGKLLIDESAPFAVNHDRWAHYLRSKLESDQLAFRYWREDNLPITVLRLGILYGPGGRPVGRGLVQLGPVNLAIGSGHNRLPFTYVGNAVDCLLLAAICQNAIGQAYNVVDEPQPSTREVALRTMKVTGERSIQIPMPPPLLSIAAWLLEWKSARTSSQTPPKMSRFVIRSACRDLCYDTRKAREQLGWQPSITLQEGLEKTLS